MLKKTIFILSLFLIICITGYAEDGILLDDCVDLSVACNHSDGVYASVIDDESKSAYDNDFTMLMRRELKREWVEYRIDDGQYPIFNTYFRQNEEIAHFEFEQSADGILWTGIKPKIKITQTEINKWIPVKYTLSNIDSDTRFIRAYFSDKNAVEWSPMLASVSVMYRINSDNSFIDCVGLDCENSVNKLKALGFVSGYNDYEFKPENNLTRAEMAKILSSILKLGTSNERVFADVSATNWVFPYLAPLYRQGIINGDENNRYNAEENVTYTEVAKMLVSALGYSVLAEDAGGYPHGFIKIANRLNILDIKNDGNYNIPLSRGDMAQMVSNALECEILTQGSFGDNAEFIKRGTILSEYHNIEEISGIMNGVSGKSIIADMKVDINYAVIGNSSYKLSEYDVSELLGMSVTAYKDNHDTIIYAESRAKKIVDISADRYIGLEDNFIYYEDNNGDELRTTIDNNTRIILNGKYYSRIGVINDLNLRCGEMRIIYNGLNSADTIIINEYMTYLVQSDGMLSGVISDRISGSDVKINTDDAEKITVMAYGENIDFNEAPVYKGDVINIAESTDGNIIDIIIESSSGSGVADYYDEADKTIKIDGKEFNLTDTVKMLGGELKLGTEITYYTDINNRIFAIENSANPDYAYLMGTSYDLFSGKVILKVLKNDGSIELITADEKTSFCGSKNKLTDISNLTPQLIKFKMRSEKAASIDIVGYNDFKMEYSSENCKYYGAGMSVFASKYQLSDNTPIFYIPIENTDDKFKVIKKNGLFSDFNYNVRIFDLSEEYVAAAVVIYEEKSRVRAVDSYDEIAVIKNAEQITNAEGDLCLKLSVYIRGNDREIYFDNDGAVDMTDNWLNNYVPKVTSNGHNPFKCGEIIQYYSDSEGHCRSFRMLLTDDLINNSAYYEKNTGDYGILNTENYFSELYTVYADVTDKFSDKLLVSVDGHILRTIPTNNANIYVYSKARNKIKLGTKADIYKGGSVFVRMSYGDTIDILVID